MRRIFTLTALAILTFAALPVHASPRIVVLDQKPEARKKSLFAVRAQEQARSSVFESPAIPTVADGSWPEDVPKVLSQADVRLYKKMFDNQRRLRRYLVARDVSKLENRVLMGHLIAERLLHPLTRAPYSDLKKWLSRYHDHSAVHDIYKLANQRRPKGQSHRKPSVKNLSVARYSDPDEPAVTRPADVSHERTKLLRRLKYYRLKGRFASSMNELNKDKNVELLGEETWAQVSLKLARTMIHEGEFELAYKMASKVIEDSPMPQPEGLWIKAFSGYRQGNLNDAAATFRKLAYSVPKNSRYYARAAWWAARCYDELDRAAMSKVFLNMASQDPYSFYGLLASETLGRDIFMRWRNPRLDKSQLKELMRNDGIRRVVALAQIGEYALAQDEMKAAYESLPYDVDETLLALSLRLHLPSVAMTLARNLMERGRIYLAGLYPMAAEWVPAGSKVDQALVNAIMRQESAFDPGVVSSAGARGLMQLMPGTARYVRQKDGKRALPRYKLYEPSINLTLGQNYVTYLDEKLDGNLIQIIAGYNAGPGNVAKWMEDKGIPSEDPILFVESIPFSETRHYVMHVMSNLWMYQKQLGRATPELAALSIGQWPATTHLYARK